MSTVILTDEDHVAEIISATLGRTIHADDIRVVGERLLAFATQPEDMPRALLGSKLTSIADDMDEGGHAYAAARGFGCVYEPRVSPLREA